MRVLLPAFAILTWVGCSNSNLPDYFALGGLRILAIQATPPEVNPGAAVTIRPLVSDLNGGTRSIDYVLEACVDPGIGLGQSPTCDHDPTKVTSTGTFTPSDSERTEEITTLPAVNVPAAALLGRSDQDQYNGVVYLVRFTVTAGSDTQSSYRRILVTTPSKTAKNANPVMSGFKLSDGTAVTQLPAETKKLLPVIAAGSAESYSLRVTDGTFRNREEELTVSWFLSEGEMKLERTAPESENEYTPASPATKPQYLWAVVRDDRGGVSYARIAK